jgi:hypothetical protein
MTRIPIVGLLLLSACGGEMHGAVQSHQGQPLGAARAEYTDSGFGSGTIKVFLPDGETFDGSWTQATAQSTASGTVGVKSGGSYASGTYFGTESYSANQYSAALIGSRGHSMQCLFHGDSLHGIGRCQVSDGRIVDITW